MDQSYFNILDSIDPRFHSYVLSKVDEIKNLEGNDDITMNDFSQADQIDVLGKYCIALYAEFVTLRSFIVENMEVCTRSIRVKAPTK